MTVEIVELHKWPRLGKWRAIRIPDRNTYAQGHTAMATPDRMLTNLGYVRQHSEQVSPLEIVEIWRRELAPPAPAIIDTVPEEQPAIEIAAASTDHAPTADLVQRAAAAGAAAGFALGILLMGWMV